MYSANISSPKFVFIENILRFIRTFCVRDMRCFDERKESSDKSIFVRSHLVVEIEEEYADKMRRLRCDYQCRTRDHVVQLATRALRA
jgi:hypothetical protein